MLSRSQVRFALFAASLAVPCVLSAQAWNVAGASVSGMVRDANGAPQMGALVQVLAPDTSLIASAVTDLKGHYRFLNLRPGSYKVRATAALFLPAQRDGLHVTSGTRSVVDLTLSTLFSVSDWLPAQRRRAEESGDDWMWTLRSSANRPILRMVNEQVEMDEDGNLVVSTNSRSERKGAAATAGRVSMMSDDGAFGHGGVHQIVTLDRLQADGSAQMVRASFSGIRTPYPVAPSADVVAGVQSRAGLNGYSRVMISYHAHPELVSHSGVLGSQSATLRAAHRMQLGDTLMVDGGSLMREVNMGGNAAAMLPFITVAVKAAEHLVLTYGYANTPEMQSLDDLDRVQVELPVAYAIDGKLRTEKTTHNAISLSAHEGPAVVEIALYHDDIHNAHIGGIGTLTADELQAGGLVADPTTQSFRALTGHYVSQGYRAGITQKIGHDISLSAVYSTGSALAVSNNVENSNLQGLLATLHPVTASAYVVALNGNISKTRTRIRSAYRWQQQGNLTPVDAFYAYDDAAYFSVHLRQPLRIRGILPDGLEAVLDVTNLLSQGYQPFVSSDGRTLYLAQSPRALQAGLAFSF